MENKKYDSETLTKFIKTCKGFDKTLEKATIVSLGAGKCTVELTVNESHLNFLGGLHGGASATLIDTVSSFALISQTGTPGVSVDLHLSYLKPAKLGDEIVVNASVNKNGKNLAFLEGEIRNKTTGDVLVKGSHTKFIQG